MMDATDIPQAFVAAFISYYLVKLVPYWGLAVIGTTAVFFVPLVYTSNQELIDEQLHHASELINSQTAQVRDVASKQMEQVSAIGKQYAGDYSGKVHDLLRGNHGSRQKIEKPTKASPVVQEPEFPSPPTEDPIKSDAAPQIPTPAALKEESTAIDAEIPEVPSEPVVANKEPMIAS